jgi:hypothetical protein
MTDLSTKDPIPIRRLSRLSFPRLEFGASLRGVFRLLDDAINMAYVAPYASLRRRPQAVREDEPDGRDPSW